MLILWGVVYLFWYRQNPIMASQIYILMTLAGVNKGRRIPACWNTGIRARGNSILICEKTKETEGKSSEFWIEKLDELRTARKVFWRRFESGPICPMDNNKVNPGLVAASIIISLYYHPPWASTRKARAQNWWSSLSHRLNMAIVAVDLTLSVGLALRAHKYWIFRARFEGVEV